MEAPESSQESAEPLGSPNPGQSRFSVLDTSALLALLFDEPGAAAVADAIAGGAAISTVNLSEAAAALVRNHRDPESILGAVTQQVSVEAFTEEDAQVAAALWAPTRGTGLSLGDRACLSLAKRLNAVTVTADREWADIDVGVTVALVRHASR